MNKQFLTAVAVTALMATPSLASAGEQGWYVRGSVGYGQLTDMDLTGDLNGAVNGSGDIAGSVGVGYGLGNNWRLELDGTQLWSELGAIGGNINSAADMRISSAMVNALYDFSDFGAWRPYVGAGIGIARANLNARTHRSFNGGAGPVFVNNAQCAAYAKCAFDDADNSTAWQVIAGLGYDISDSLVWDTQYRYLNLGTLEYDGLGGSSGVAVAPGGSGTKISTSIGNADAHIIMTGLRYRFGGQKVKTTKYKTEYVAPVATMYACADGSQASSLASCVVEVAQTFTCWDGAVVSDRSVCTLPPAPAVEATTEVAQYDPCDVGTNSFVVYFPWDKATLTEQAKNVIVDASNTAKLCDIGSLIIEGHADSSGAPGYNVGLSGRRVSAVEAELKANGVSTENVVKSAKGESALALPTGDGVREPLNRRTEVLIQLIPGTYLTQ